PVGRTIERTEEIVTPVEEIIATVSDEELIDYVTSIGSIQQKPNDPQTRRGSNFDHNRVSLTPEADRKRTAAEIVDDLRQKIGTPAGAEKISFEYMRQGPPQGQPVAFTLWGDDFKEIEELTEEVKKIMSEIPGVLDI